MSNLLEVTDLSIQLSQQGKAVELVKGVSFNLRKGSVLGLVGESGSGKSLTALALMNLLDPSVLSVSGSVLFNPDNNPQELLSAERDDLDNIRGSEIAMIFQEPLSSINPNKKCGIQLIEVIRSHRPVDKNIAESSALQLLKDVGLPEPHRIMKSFPHQLSGGQLQRVIIAIAISCSPRLLIADEPTTSLDVTTQKEILELISSLQQKLQMACIFISHDPLVISEVTNEVMVMQNGEIIESGKTRNIFKDPQNPYTKQLVAYAQNIKEGSVLDSEEDKGRTDVLLSIEGLSVSYMLKQSVLLQSKVFLTALNKVSFSVLRGSMHGIVGESGSGKSTLAKCLVGIEQPISGTIKFNEASIYHDGDYVLERQNIQMVFQDPYESLNPRMKVGKSIGEVVKLYDHKDRSINLKHKVNQLLSEVGLDDTFYGRYPHQLSGGQRQRICIARALAADPRILICDEAVSALDISIQEQIIKLLNKLKKTYHLTIIFISHDLSVVRSICDHVTVLCDGRIEENGTVNELFNNPRSQYTQHLLESIPGHKKNIW
jgi:peptide/nickel transport system ATP-binding protein